MLADLRYVKQRHVAVHDIMYIVEYECPNDVDDDGDKNGNEKRGDWFKCSIYWAQANGITSVLALSTSSSSSSDFVRPSPIITHHLLRHYACFSGLSAGKLAKCRRFDEKLYCTLSLFLFDTHSLSLPLFHSIPFFGYVHFFFQALSVSASRFVFTITYVRIIRR